jgi:hypothetical protein
MINPFNLLRATLGARLTISVESTEPLIASVERSINTRRRVLARKGKTAAFKTPRIVPTLAGRRSRTIRPIDLLRKLGDITTPPFLPLENMARLSASWATRRYFWAIAPLVAPSTTGPFRLSAEARELDFHQKTLLSDEFGVGMAGLLMEEYFDAVECWDMSYALRQPNTFQGVSLVGSTSPDYVMWGPGATYYIVECKGCQTNRSVAINQIRRGLEQVISVRFGSGPYRSESLVVSTFLDRKNTRVLVVDPPDDEEPPEEEPPKARTIFFEDPEAFAKRASLENRARLLSWAGLYQPAARIFHELGRPAVAVESFERPRQIRETLNGLYEGTTAPLFPELGRKELILFTGVRPDLIEPTGGQPEAGDELSFADSSPTQALHDIPSNMSWGKNGTCMIVEGL